MPTLEINKLFLHIEISKYLFMDGHFMSFCNTACNLIL